MTCKHLKTQGRENQKGSWCIDCGLKVFDVETKPCGECKHFKKTISSSVIAYCRLKEMTVTSNLKVTYKVVDGSCFVSDKTGTLE